MLIILLAQITLFSLGIYANDGCQHKCQEEKTCYVQKITNFCYYIFHKEIRTWEESRKLCDNENLTMGEVSENQTGRFNIQELMKDLDPNVNAWLGGKALDLDKWTFINNVTISKDNTNAPTRFIAGEEMNLCGVVSADGKLDKYDCTKIRHFICRFEQKRGISTYLISELPDTWFEACAECAKMGGSLFSLKNNEDTNNINSQLKYLNFKNQTLFIGLIRRRWVWQDEKDIIFYNWAVGKPNNLSKRCVSVIPRDAVWTDADCTEKMYTLCQRGVDVDIPTGKPTAEIEEKQDTIQIPVLMVPIVVITILAIIIMAVVCYKNLQNAFRKTKKTNTVSLQELGLLEAEHLLTKEPLLGPWECIQCLRNVKDNIELDLSGNKILRVLQEDQKSILENDPNILTVLIKKADKLIDSEYYEDIIKVAPHGGKDSPLKYLLGILRSGEENFKKLFKDQKKLMSVIQIISSYGDVQYRTQCLNYISFKRTFGFIWEEREYSFEWSEKYLSTVKELLENGADPTWIHPGYLEKERKDRHTAQNEFFFNIFVNVWEKNDLHESLLQVLPLMLSKKCKDNELHQGTLLHAFVYPRFWDYIATNLESMPPDFFLQFKNILREILRQDGTLLDQKDFERRTPLQCFLIDIKLGESIFGEVREIIQLLQTPQVLSSQDNDGWTALHYLAICFPVIRGEVSQSRRESFLELVKSFANESNVGCQNRFDGRTALHHLAGKFPDEISEESREIYQDFVKHLATYDILEKKDKNGRTALHYLAYYFTFEIEDWKMETFVEVLKCLAVPRTICIKDKDGDTALEMISRKWGKKFLRRNKIPEHYKDKFQEISDILGENN